MIWTAHWPRETKPSRPAVVAGIAIAVLAVFSLVGCSSSENTRTAIQPPQESTVAAPSEADTTTANRPPPIPDVGVPTAPTRVTDYDSTSEPSREVVRAQISEDETQIVYPNGTVEAFNDVVPGETLTLYFGPDTTTAEVTGTPEQDTTTVLDDTKDEPEDKGLFGRLWGSFRQGVFVVGLVVLLAVAASIAKSVGLGALKSYAPFLS